MADIFENKETDKQDSPLSDASALEGKESQSTEESGQVQTSEPSATTYETNGELIALQEHYEAVETHLDNLTNIGIICIIGIAMIIGVIGCSVFSRYFNSKGV